MASQRVLRALVCATVVVGGWSVLWAGEASQGEVPGSPSPAASSVFLRIRRDDQKEPVAMETAVTRYVAEDEPRKGLTVDLIGAVHVGESEYYAALNKLFQSYDGVLYELVAPEGTRAVPEPSGGKRHPISYLQHVMKNVLKLDFQLDRVNYSAPNMVHADMSPEQFSQSMKERGESFFSMFLRMFKQSLAAQAGRENGPSDVDMLIALVAKDRAFRLKRLMAEQFEDLEGAMSALDGPDGSTIITERNKKALEVLRKQIDQGKRKLAVFYGAGHLPDMEKRLLSDFGLKRGSQQWLVAWSLTRPAGAAEPAAKTDAAGTEAAKAGQ